DELGHAAVHGDAQLFQLLAQVHAPHLAPAADATPDADLHADPRAGDHLGHSLADLGDLAGDLVADDEAAPATRVHLAVDPLVAAANAHPPPPDQPLPGADARHRNFLQHDTALGGVLDDGQHAAIRIRRRSRYRPAPKRCRSRSRTASLAR